jgi:uncharacterized surface protein with fasciclin (FAS1) repeats
MFFNHKLKSLLPALLAVLIVLAGCNKELPEPIPLEPPVNGTSPTIASLLDDPTLSILKAAVTKAGLMPLLADNTLRVTVFAPTDAGFAAAGISLPVIDAMPAEQVAAVVSYHIIPQAVTTAMIPSSFPNFEYPSILNPAPSLSPLLRLSTFPSKRGSTVWVNNIPVIGADITAVNGVVHKMATVVAPPTQDLWTRINSDPNLTYLKATIERADSGVVAGARLLDALSITANPSAIGSNLTIFAPNDIAMKAFLTGAIYKALLAQVVPQPPNPIDSATALGTANFLVATYGTLLITNPYAISPALGAAISPALAKGVVAYHIISSQSAPFLPPGLRLFSVNIPTTPTAVKTFVNSGFTDHPGVNLQATFGPAGVTAIKVQGLANATASNVLINPLPNGTSDQHSVNGVIHFIDQVLLPQ